MKMYNKVKEKERELKENGNLEEKIRKNSLRTFFSYLLSA
jgi:hypothetical protein